MFGRLSYACVTMFRITAGEGAFYFEGLPPIDRETEALDYGPVPSVAACVHREREREECVDRGRGGGRWRGRGGARTFDFEGQAEIRT